MPQDWRMPRAITTVRRVRRLDGMGLEPSSYIDSGARAPSGREPSRAGGAAIYMLPGYAPQQRAPSESLGPAISPLMPRVTIQVEQRPSVSAPTGDSWLGLTDNRRSGTTSRPGSSRYEGFPAIFEVQRKAPWLVPYFDPRGAPAAPDSPEVKKAREKITAKQIALNQAKARTTQAQKALDDVVQRRNLTPTTAGRQALDTKVGQTQQALFKAQDAEGRADAELQQAKVELKRLLNPDLADEG